MTSEGRCLLNTGKSNNKIYILDHKILTFNARWLSVRGNHYDMLDRRLKVSNHAKKFNTKQEISTEYDVQMVSGTERHPSMQMGRQSDSSTMPHTSLWTFIT